MDGRFPEPRGWALKWEGPALFPEVSFVSQHPADHGPAAGARGSAVPTGWAPQWRQVTDASASRTRNGNRRNLLARPRGWALKWDGAALIGSMDGGEPAFLRAVECEKEGAV